MPKVAYAFVADWNKPEPIQKCHWDAKACMSLRIAQVTEHRAENKPS